MTKPKRGAKRCGRFRKNSLASKSESLSQFRNLKLFPVIRREVNKAALDYLLLEDGIAQGKVRVTELSGGGSVSGIEHHQRGRAANPAVDGEELVGAKQNRVLNLSILVPAKQTMAIPVCCVEAGRWRSASCRPEDSGSHDVLRGREDNEFRRSRGPCDPVGRVPQIRAPCGKNLRQRLCD